MQKSGLLVCSSQNHPCKAFLKTSVIAAIFQSCVMKQDCWIKYCSKLVVINFIFEFFWSFWVKKKIILPPNLLRFELLIFSETSSPTPLCNTSFKLIHPMSGYFGVKALWLLMCMLIQISQLAFCDVLVFDDFWSHELSCRLSACYRGRCSSVFLVLH